MNLLVDFVRNTLLNHNPLIFLLGGPKVYFWLGNEEFTGNINIGRLPLILIKNAENQYDFTSEPFHAGDRKYILQIRIIVPHFISRNSWELLENIKKQVIIALKDSSYQDFSNSSPTLAQNSLFLDIFVTFDTTFDEDLHE